MLGSAMLSRALYIVALHIKGSEEEVRLLAAAAEHLATIVRGVPTSIYYKN